MKVHKKKQASENNYFNKFQSDFGFDTASVTQEDDKEAKAIRKLLTFNPLTHEG